MIEKKLFQYKAGEIVFSEGDPAGPAYVIVSGKAEVVVNSMAGEKTIAIISEKGIFGEVSMTDGLPRSATIKALGDMTCYEINVLDFNRMFGTRRTVARSLFEIQCSRLRQAAENIKIQL